jgi:2-C-methyl-D-erythritol 4-phosphate cytidylyltransferase
MADFHVLIPAAGSGSRMGNDMPKQYLPLLDRPLIEHTLAVFAANSRIRSVTVVLSRHDTTWNELDIGDRQSKLHSERCGGETRAASVLNGLEVMREHMQADDWVLVHDAARPCLSGELLERLLDTLQDDDIGGLLAIPLADTLKRADNGQRVLRTEARDGLWQAQTPQMFRYALLKNALQAAAERDSGSAPTDEAQAVEALGFMPRLVPGELRNLKITYPQDLLLAEAILRADRQRGKIS